MATKVQHPSDKKPGKDLVSWPSPVWTPPRPDRPSQTIGGGK